MMTEADARAWLQTHLHVSRETCDLLGAFLNLVVKENERQNLISRATITDAWLRHIIDSAQLMRFAPLSARTWIDFGTGAGFPGIVAAILFSGEVTMVEERRLRSEFLERSIAELGLENRAKICASKLERVPPRAYDIISARAFAPLDKLLSLGEPFAAENTRWILPKGRNARSELEAARGSWQGAFRLEESVTDPDAGIIIADSVEPAPKGRARR